MLDLPLLDFILIEHFAKEVVVESLYCRFPDGALVTVAAVQWRPHCILSMDADGHREVTGPMGHILTVIAQTLNFT